MKKTISAILCLVLIMAIVFPAAAISAVTLKSVKLDKSAITLKVGQSAALKVTLSPSNTTQKSLAFATSSQLVALVDSNGKITAISAGTAKITVTSASDSKVAATCTVTVSKNPVTLKFATFNGWQNSQTGLQSAFKMYTAATGNKITQDIYPNDQFQNILKAKLATGDVPDFFAINCGESYVPFTNLEPLSGPWVDKMISPVKAKATRSSDGKICEAYWSPVGFLGMVYNKDVFKKAGVNVPLMNYQQLLAACKAIQKTGVTPILVMGKQPWTLSQIIWDGGNYCVQSSDVVSKIRSNKAKPSQVPQIVDMDNRLLGLKPYINQDYLSVDLDQTLADLINEKAAMTCLGDFTYGECAKAFPDKVKNLSEMPITLGDNYINAVGSYEQHSFGVPSASKLKEAAKAAINYFMEPTIYKTLVSPDLGGSAYIGYSSAMDPWQADMSAMISKYNIPQGNCWYEYLFTNTTKQFGPLDYGASVGTVYMDMFAGKDVKTALDDWYKDYAQVNQAKKTPGFDKLLP